MAKYFRQYLKNIQITRVDSPIPSASVSPIHSTPSKKRRVPDVIAENDASSRGSSSPEYGPDRASKRIATPKHIRCQSDGRYSVESTSNHANTPQRRNYTESNATPIPLKLESKLKVCQRNILRKFRTGGADSSRTPIW